MTEQRKTPSPSQPTQANQSQPEQALPADRGQFETQLQQAVAHAGATAPPSGAGAMPNLRGLWSFLAGALTDPAVRDLLWSLFQRWKGGTAEPTPQPPAPPPEPAS
jgi:hypothetical protein